jgi:hypothetical protein
MPSFDITFAMDVFGEAPELPDPMPRHLRDLVQLADDLVLGPVTPHKQELIEACDPRGVNWLKPHRAYGSQYAFARLSPPGSSYEFDPDRRLLTCIQLSRLAHPTAVAYEFAGRLLTRDSGEVESFSPARLRGGSAVAFVTDPTRNWLSDDNVECLRQLLQSFDRDALPERVLRALFYHEYVHQLFYVDARWPMATTGLESFLHTDQAHSTRQFIQRALGLQDALAVRLATEDDLAEIYDRRSALAHGQSFGGLTDDNRRLYTALEDLLRSAIRRAILDPGFAAIFTDSAAIRARWPL